MPSNYLRLYVHLVWKTWDKLPLITPEVRGQIYPVLLQKLRELNCSALAIGGVEDHVHVLLEFPATICLADLLKGIKGPSSRAVNQKWPDRFFKWQGSYGAVVVSPSALAVTRQYIENQVEHHRRGDLNAELEAVTDDNNIAI